MPPPSKRVKAARHNGCGDCAGTKRANEMASQMEMLKAENNRLLEENRLLAERSQRFPDLLAVWRSRYEEAMNKNLSKVLMHSGDVYIPMGVHLREMKTVDTWKKRFEIEQKRRKDLEGYIEKWKKNNNQLRKEIDNEEKAHKRTKKMLEILMYQNKNGSHSLEDEKKDTTVWPVDLDDIKLEEVSEDTMISSDVSSSTPNELLSKLACLERSQWSSTIN